MHKIITDNSFDHWLNEEVGDTKFSDKRLVSRFKILLGQLWKHLGQPIPLACQDWANTKAAYRFLSNDKITIDKILQGHFSSTKQRVKSTCNSYILVIQDTTEFSYNRKEAGEVGWTKLFNSNRDLYKKCGMLMHSSLVVTPEGLPLGLCAIKFWNRKNFKGTNKLKKIINPMRVSIETKESIKWLENLTSSISLLEENERCVHIGDRESDIYELFCLSEELNTNFLIRSCQNRLIDDEHRKIEAKMNATPIVGEHVIKLENYKNRKDGTVFLDIKFQRVQLIVPIDKKKRFRDVSVTIIDAIEKNCSEEQEPIFWRLITNLEISTIGEAIEKVEWYNNRWKIEIFHKILKSGFKSESVRLRTSGSLMKIISIFCILAWRVFWMTMINRISPNGSPKLILTEDEINFVDAIDHKVNLKCKKVISEYVHKIAKLGGYLARLHDPPPGNMVIWRGMRKLNDMLYGYKLGKKEVENINISNNKNAYENELNIFVGNC